MYGQEFSVKYTPFRLLGCLLLICGCSTKHFKEDADKEVYGILKQKHKAALGIEHEFTIEQDQGDPLVGMPLTQPEPLADVEQPPSIKLNLVQCMEVAGKTNRNYQSEREGLYLSALSLTDERNRWGPILSGDLSAAYVNTKDDETVGGTGGLGLAKRFADGTRLGITLSADLLTHLVSNPREAATSIVDITLTKPLWRGARKRIAQENLLQAERKVVYAIRDFARYRKTFAVQTATEFYRALQGRDGVINAWNNYQNLVTARVRTEMMAEAGRLPEFQVDQARQNEFSAQDRYIRAVQGYQQSLDRFKLSLGLPTDSPIRLDVSELERVRQQGIIHPDVGAEQAVAIALQARLDLTKARDEVEDAGRKVVVAENGLAPDIDLVLSSELKSTENRPGRLRPDAGTHSAGINVALPLERTDERNTYRRALIDLEQSKRNAIQREDSIKLEVRGAWRKRQEARARYEIQLRSLELAERRVESTELLQQLGRADTRDVLEAEDALLGARNSVTEALVDHTIAKLEFWRDTGVLEVNEDGLWEEDYEWELPAEDEQDEQQ